MLLWRADDNEASFFYGTKRDKPTFILFFFFRPLNSLRTNQTISENFFLLIYPGILISHVRLEWGAY